MRIKVIAIVLLAVVAVAGWLPWRRSPDAADCPQTPKVLFYRDSMHPWIKSDRPGKCALCGMDLKPVHERESRSGGSEDVVALGAGSVTVLNVQTEEVKRRNLRRALRVTGSLDANEGRRTVVSAPAAGRIEETAIDYAGVEVREGQRLLTFYSPELTQQKYRYLVRAQRAPEQRDPTGGLSRQKGDADPYYTDLMAPIGGTVIERNVSRGQYVSEGERLLTIADASVLWFRFDVYEKQLTWLRLGQKVSVSVPAFPGKAFDAVISFIDPMLDPATRTVKVRADIANPIVETDGIRQRYLKFGMSAEGAVMAEFPNVLTLPRAAVLAPGLSTYAYVDKGGNAYERRYVKLGRQGDEAWEVLQGVENGEHVVTSGNVLLDAQAQFSLHEATDEGTAATGLTAAIASLVSCDQAVANIATPVEHVPTETATAVATTCSSTNSSEVSVAVNRTAPSPRSGARPRTRMPAGVQAPDANAGRMLEGAMFVRMAELRNAELAEARAAKVAKDSALSEPQVQDSGTDDAGPR